MTLSAEGLKAVASIGLHRVLDHLGQAAGRPQPVRLRPPAQQTLAGCRGRRWPTLLALSERRDQTKERRADIDLWVGADCAAFEGHFPGQPILPGVVQAHWACELGRRLFTIDGMFMSLQNLKFQQPVLPESLLRLTLSFDLESGRLQFHYTSNDQPLSQGRVYFEPTGEGPEP